MCGGKIGQILNNPMQAISSSLSNPLVDTALVAGGAYFAAPALFGGAAAAGGAAGGAAAATDPLLAGDVGGAGLWAPATGAGSYATGAAVGAAAAGGAAAGGAASTLSQLGAGINLGTGIMGLLGASNIGGAGTAADPFAAYRSAAAQQLMQLQQNPSLVTQTPGYMAGMQAIERSMAGQGYLNSGIEAQAMAQYGGQAYQQQFSNLAMLSGASTSPATGASVNVGAQTSQLQAQTAALNRLGSSLTYYGGGANQNPQNIFGAGG